MLKADELRPLIKSNGDYTYLSSDLAYHDYKLSEFDLVINIWGADHHGYVPRIRLGMEALGHNVKKLDIQDYIFVSVKAHSISNIVDNLSPIISDQTSIISAVNGLPWWYFYKSNTGTNLDDKYIESVDPNGKIWNTFKPERAIGCVVYPACEITEPGVIKHNEGERFSLGEPDST